jgi:hypothetical protein
MNRLHEVSYVPDSIGLHTILNSHYTNPPYSDSFLPSSCIQKMEMKRETLDYL